jgi:hypothetical protein
VLLSARSLIDHQRTANRNALTALLRTVDLGIDTRSPLTDKQVLVIASWRNIAFAKVVHITTHPRRCEAAGDRRS